MSGEIIIIEKGEADSIAAGYFEIICGFNRDKEKFKKMLEHGMAVRDAIYPEIDVRAVVAEVDPAGLAAERLTVGETSFFCNAFAQMPEGAVKHIYPFILAGRGFELPEAPVIEQFYADTWGTAYIDAGRDLLRQALARRHEAVFEPARNEAVLAISDSFGPGYYGMRSDQLKHFFEVLPADDIGVSLAGNEVMVPLKSCAGFFIIVDAQVDLPGDDCKSCLAEAKGCNFCRTRVQKISAQRG